MLVMAKFLPWMSDAPSAQMGATSCLGCYGVALLCVLVHFTCFSWSLFGVNAPRPTDAGKVEGCERWQAVGW